MKTTNNKAVSTPISTVGTVLASLNRDQLRDLAKRHGVPTARYKRDMIARLVTSRVNVNVTIS